MIDFDADLVIVGGGPAGLAAAIQAARRNLRVIVLERAPSPPDKACGEGLMPAGVRALIELGAHRYLNHHDASPFIGIRYRQENGSSISGQFRNGSGLGIRRTALATALTTRASEVGAMIQFGCKALAFENLANGIRLQTTAGSLTAKLLIAADGLASPLRKLAGLNQTVRQPDISSRRFGLRRHFRIAPWSDFVEIYWGDGVEAYVTPAGREQLGIALLWWSNRFPQASFESLLMRFPALAERLSEAEPISPVIGAGPLLRTARAQVADRFLLIGDAAGYIDAISGEGLSLAFRAAAALGQLLPQALTQDATRAALLPYQQHYRRGFREYALITQMLLYCSRHGRFRQWLLDRLANHPTIFQSIFSKLTSGSYDPADQDQLARSNLLGNAVKD